MKQNLPVLLLKELILLPSNEIRLEFDSEFSSSIIDVAEIYHNNLLFVVSQNNPLEENPDVSDLPRVGVIAKINHKLTLPNGKKRVVIAGLRRAFVSEYLDLNEVVISEIEVEDIPNDIVIGTIRKLYHELEQYIKNVPYVSNSILALISNTKDIDKLTDIIVMQISLDNKRLKEYVNQVSSLKRVEMILEDIYKDEQLYEIEKKLDSKVKKEMDNNQKEFLLREKVKLIKEELGDLSYIDNEVDVLRDKVNKLKCSDKVKDRLNKEIIKYENIPSNSPEVSVVRNYIDWLLDLPWGIYTKDYEDIKKVKNSLDQSHYGLDNVKRRIIEYLAVKKYTKKLSGSIICLVGPSGVGKTTLAYSIAKSIRRNFVKISVGGVNDEGELIGHRRTYLGAGPGRIIDGMRRAKSSNPVFLIDEIDKMTKDYKGDPASVLLEILDNTQNKYFRDNYLEEEYDLSNVMFIVTANDLTNIPKALLDRLEVISISGYTEFEKLDIAKKYLLPKICKIHGIKKIKMEDEFLLDIIRYYTKEAGVRDLERKISSILRQVVTDIVMKKDKVSNHVLQINDVSRFLGKKKFFVNNLLNDAQIGVVNGLAFTSYGGDIMPIEVNYFKGNGNLILTGSLGEIFKESAKIALSYIKANYKLFSINYDDLLLNDIHVHIPSGSISKEGPSAGVNLTTALISAFTNLKISGNIAMTGEITLRGNILAIGSLKEKIIGAKRNNINIIFIPYDNINDLEEISNDIKDGIKFIPVRNYLEIYNFIRKM